MYVLDSMSTNIYLNLINDRKITSAVASTVAIQHFIVVIILTQLNSIKPSRPPNPIMSDV